MKRREFKLPIKIIGVATLSLVCIFIILFFPIRYLINSKDFKIKNSLCITPGRIQQGKLDYLKRNIFRVNLQEESKRLTKHYPDYKRIVLERSLPDTIIIDLTPRQAIAKVKLSEYFYVDEEGVLFHSISKQDENLQLPVIIGLGRRISNPRPGVKYNENSLIRTLEFINNLNKDPQLTKKLKIEKINLSNANDVILFTTNGCKINLGTVGSLSRKLSILQRLISEIDSDLVEIQYIDLRFKEPVVKYR